MALCFYETVNRRIMARIGLEEREELGNAAMQRKPLCRAERLGGIPYTLLPSVILKM